MEKLTSSKVMAIASTALLAASVFWLLNTRQLNSSLESGLKEERLKSEQLLSEKLQLEKEIGKFKVQLNSLTDKNIDLTNVVNGLTSRLKNQETDYNRMKKENLSLAQIRKQKQELIALRNELENELTALRASYADLESRNGELNTTVAELRERNRVLSDDLSKAMFASIDQSQIEALRKSEKLTVRARRTKKLVANLQVPANLKNLSFRIVDPRGNPMTQEAGTIAAHITPAEQSFTASAETAGTEGALQKVQMVYSPKHRLQSGTYTVEVMNDNLYVSSIKVKLK